MSSTEADTVSLVTDVEEPRHAGDVIVRADIGGTAVFAVTSIAAAVVFTEGIQWVAAVVAISLFFVGIAAFLWSFWNAVQRSRGEQVAVTQLYLLMGGVAPRRVRRSMMLLLAVQTIVGLATALARPDSSDGSPGTSLALGVLVPVFGLGLNGLWAAFHGTFGERVDAGQDHARPSPTSGTNPTATIDKNEEHG